MGERIVDQKEKFCELEQGSERIKTQYSLIKNIRLELIQMNNILATPYFKYNFFFTSINSNITKTLALNYLSRRSPSKYCRRFIAFHN